MSDTRQRIQHDHGEPTFFAMIPKMAILELDPFALKLYCHYKQVVGENPHRACFKSNQTLSEALGMSVNRMKQARALLESKHYIRVQHTAGGTATVTLRNVWAINHQRFAMQSEGGVSNPDTLSNPDRGVSNPDTKEERIKEERIKAAAAALNTRPKVYTFYEQTTGSAITPYIAEAIMDACRKYGEDTVQDAMTEAALSNGRSWKYIHNILQRWGREGRFGAPTTPIPQQRLTDDLPPLSEAEDWGVDYWVRQTGGGA